MFLYIWVVVFYYVFIVFVLCLYCALLCVYNVLLWFIVFFWVSCVLYCFIVCCCVFIVFYCVLSYNIRGINSFDYKLCINNKSYVRIKNVINNLQPDQRIVEKCPWQITRMWSTNRCSCVFKFWGKICIARNS